MNSLRLLAASAVLVAVQAIAPVIATPPASAETPPYPRSPFITGIRFDWSSHHEHGDGSDNWMFTWAADGYLYSPFGDGSGFARHGRQAYVSIGLARLSGNSAATVGGANLIGGLNPSVDRCMQLIRPDMAETRQELAPLCHRIGRHGKSWGALALDDQLHLWISPGSSAAELYREARLYRAPLGANRWTRAAWAFSLSDPVPVVQPTFLQAGQNHADLDHHYIYAIRHAPVETRLGIHRSAEGGQLMLMRAAKGSDLLLRENYEYFAGRNTDGEPIWTGNPARQQPVFTDPAGVGWTVSAAFVAELGRYLLITEHARSFASEFGIFESREPTGPWRTVFYDTLSAGTARVPAKGFFANFLPNGWSPDGRRFTLAFTGIEELDSLNLVDGTLALDERFR